VIGAVIALRIRIPLRVIGLIVGFGAGVLISAVAFDLVDRRPRSQPDAER
jgi:ZIP family zinc transporter